MKRGTWRFSRSELFQRTIKTSKTAYLGTIWFTHERHCNWVCIKEYFVKSLKLRFSSNPHASDFDCIAQPWNVLVMLSFGYTLVRRSNLVRHVRSNLSDSRKSSTSCKHIVVFVFLMRSRKWVMSLFYTSRAFYVKITLFERMRVH